MIAGRQKMHKYKKMEVKEGEDGDKGEETLRREYTGVLIAHKRVPERDCMMMVLVMSIMKFD